MAGFKLPDMETLRSRVKDIKLEIENNEKGQHFNMLNNKLLHNFHFLK